MSEALMKAYVVGDEARPGQSKQLPQSAWHQDYVNGQAVEPPYDLEALAELYETNATHKACVDAKVVNCVGLGYRFVPTVGQDGKAATANRALLEHLLATCNPEMTFTEVMRAIWTDVECLGNSYMEVTRNSLGNIDGFYHVPATTIRIKPDDKGFVQLRGTQKRHFRSLGAEALADPVSDEPQNELIHFKKYTPQSGIYGIPDIVAALAAAAGDRAAREYNIDFFEHNAVPRMAIIIEGGQLSQELLAQIQNYMQTEIKGSGHKTLVLDVPGADTKVRIEPLTVGQHDEAAFLDYRKANRDEILMVHRVPPSKITIVENANLANSRDQDKTFREQVIRPEQRRIEYQINRMIREQMGIGDWEFRFRQADLGEEREEAEIARIYADLGVWTVDEIRQQQGLEPLVESEEQNEDSE
ncbi:MAG: phage portal protein [Armatimonadetes bacterium]|nr:phage portal protein [Armatimonadota bacterium]